MAEPTADVPPQAAAHRRRGMFAALGACTIWGASFLMSKVALRELDAPDVVLWRFLSAAPFLLVLARRMRPERRHVPVFLVGGFVGVPLLFLLQVEGVALTTATRASLVIGAIPPLVALGAALVLGERFTRRLAASLALSTAGLVVLVGGPTQGRYLVGDGLVFASVLVSVAFVLLSGRAVRRYAPAGAAAWFQLAGTAWLVAGYALWRGLPPVPQLPGTWLATLGLGVGCTVLANVLWNMALRDLGASRAGLFVNLEPLVGALLGITLLGESFGVGAALGGALIVAAALLTVLGSQGKPVPAAT